VKRSAARQNDAGRSSKERLLGLDDDDEQCEQGERLDERQAEDQKQEQAWAGTGVPGQSFACRADGPALAETAEAGGNSHADACANWDETGRAGAAICEGGNGEAQRR
jgi:hypothetical protein